MIKTVLSNLINRWVALAIVLIALALLGASYAAVLLAPVGSAPLPGQAALTVIPAPSPSPVLTTVTPQVSPTPEPRPTTTLAAGTIGVGAFVQIAGTGGDGLRLRTGPNLDSEVRFLGLEAEVFLVQDGPQQADSYTWWYLAAPYDETRQGWAVASYLVVIQNP